MIAALILLTYRNACHRLRLGAACEAAAGLSSLALPTGLALIALFAPP